MLADTRSSSRDAGGGFGLDNYAAHSHPARSTAITHRVVMMLTRDKSLSLCPTYRRLQPSQNTQEMTNAKILIPPTSLRLTKGNISDAEAYREIILGSPRILKNAHQVVLIRVVVSC